MPASSTTRSGIGTASALPTWSTSCAWAAGTSRGRRTPGRRGSRWMKKLGSSSRAIATSFLLCGAPSRPPSRFGDAGPRSRALSTIIVWLGDRTHHASRSRGRGPRRRPARSGRGADPLSPRRRGAAPARTRGTRSPAVMPASMSDEMRSLPPVNGVSASPSARRLGQRRDGSRWSPRSTTRQSAGSSHGAAVVSGLRIVGDECREQLPLGRRAWQRQHPGERLVEHHREAVHVRSRVRRRGVGHLLGRQVHGRSRRAAPRSGRGACARPPRGHRRGRDRGGSRRGTARAALRPRGERPRARGQRGARCGRRHRRAEGRLRGARPAWSLRGRGRASRGSILRGRGHGVVAAGAAVAAVDPARLTARCPAPRTRRPSIDTRSTPAPARRRPAPPPGCGARTGSAPGWGCARA